MEGFDVQRIEGRGVVLRPWRDSDVPAMVELFDEPQVALRTPLPSPFTQQAARDRLDKARDPDLLLLAVTTDGERPLGEVMVTSTGTMGYALGARHRGQGLATRALTLLRDHAHDVLGLPVLQLEIEPDNEASIAVARASGFSLVPGATRSGESKGRRYELHRWEHVAG